MLLKKREIAIALTAAAVVICGAGVCEVQAATHIDKNAKVTVTAQIGDDDSTIFGQSYNGTVDIDLYKLGDLDESGNPILVSDYSDSDIDLDILSNNPKVADIEEKIVEPAVTAVENRAADYTITASRKDDGFSGSVSIEPGAGIYLYLPRDTKDEKYSYSFTPYIIYAPTSDCIVSGDASADDTWKYDVAFIIKPKETPIEITIPDNPPPTHHEEIEYGEDIIEQEAEIVMYNKGSDPKTGDEVLPLFICGLAFIIGLGMIIWYFNNKKSAQQK